MGGADPVSQKAQSTVTKGKRTGKFSQNNTDKKFCALSISSTIPPTNTSTLIHPATPVKDDEAASSRPGKRKRRNKKKKKKNDGSAEEIKPVLIVKNPEDYSANWKKLQEILNKEKSNIIKPEEKESVSRAFSKHRNGDTRQGKKPYKKSLEKITEKVKEPEDTKKEEEEEEEEIWFDNVDPILIEETRTKKKIDEGGTKNSKKASGNSLVKDNSFEGTTKTIAMDCEMVGVGMNGKESMLARVSLVNHYGKLLYDKFVKPTEEVTDYRTAISGVRPSDLVDACEFSVVQKEVAELIQGHILVGHSIRNDLRALYLTHPRSDIRDTSKYKFFVKKFGGRTPSLKKLTERFLGIEIQQGEHSSVQDAQAAMRLYTMHRKQWEKARAGKYRRKYMNQKGNSGGETKPTTDS